jgi:Flp pilus assembly protein CpaB
LLVAMATVVLFSVAQRDSGAATERYVVARRSLAIGTRLTASDLTAASLHFPAGPLRGRVFTRPAPLVGAVVIAPVAAGELVQASAVLAATAAGDQRQISVPIDAARALGDRLQPGELVDVIATFGSGADAFTVAVVHRARIVARDGATGTLGDRKGEVIVLSIGSAEDAVAIAHAVAAGQISLVRVSGVAPDATDDGASPYRAPRPGGVR